MTIKSFFKLFIPPILFKVKDWILDFFAKKNISFVSTISDINKSSDKFIVIGNGPSLKESVEKYSGQISKYDCIVVNYFCKTEYYKLLKPRFYLFADPIFFEQLDTIVEWKRNKINGFIDSIIRNTEWDLNLIVPSIAIGSEFIKQIERNSFIHLHFYNSNDLVKYNEDTKFSLWDKNLISVPAQTCLNTCVWLGIFLRYKEVFLLGADTTWIELLHVDQETNEVYTIDSHFYGQEKIPLYKDSAGKIPVKLYEELISISNALKLYCELKEYADYAEVKVYNASEYSLIDAFDRKKFPS